MSTTTPNMNLILPDVSGPATSGPEWASELNAAIQKIDLHDHSSGLGLKITPAGLNINADLDVVNNSILRANKVNLKNQTTTLSGVSNTCSVSFVNGNLYITNGGGIPVQITNGTSVVNTTIIPASPLMPSGTILDYAGSVIPAGFLACNGSNVSRTLYPDLFTTLGTSFGSGDGTTTFTLPNFNGKVSVGSGTYADTGTATNITRSLAQGQVANGSSNPLGESVHLLSVAEMPSHTHIQDAHAHSLGRIGTGFLLQEGSSGGYSSGAGNTGSTTATNQFTGGTASHNNMQPSLVINKMIKT